MTVIRRLLKAVGRVVGAIFGAIFGGIQPPAGRRPPDIDGRRDSHDMGSDRAALEARMRDQVGPGGTPG